MSERYYPSEYQRVVLPGEIDINDPLKKEAFCNDLVLQIQGESVELEDTTNHPLLLIAFLLIEKYSQELVFVAGAERFSLFDYHRSPIIEPNPAAVIFSEKDLTFKSPLEAVEKLNINLEEIWANYNEIEIINHLKLNLEHFKKIIRPAKSITLTGIVPSLFLLYVFIILKNVSKEIYYQAKETDLPIKIC